MITSSSNRHVRDTIALQKKAREREERDLFVVEGPKMFLEAPSDRVVQVYVSESFRGGQVWEKNRALFEKTPCETVSDEVFRRMSDTQNPQGVLCLLRGYHYKEEDLLGRMSGRKPLLMILEDLQDPGNLGTILRSGEGAGITGILMSRGCVDISNPKVIRSTMGSVYRVPFAYTDDLGVSLDRLKKRGVSLFAAHLRGKRSYDQEDYSGPAGFLIGNESRGLSDETAAKADTLVRIPMLGQVESLNAAMASGILMYEAARQRRG